MAWREHPLAPAPGTRLCAIVAIPPRGRGFTWGEGRDAFRLFVFNTDDGIRAYVNRCPHFQIPLDANRDRFLTRDLSKLMCLHHLAEFRLSDGYCFAGPCQGRSLEPVEIAVHDDEVFIAEPLPATARM